MCMVISTRMLAGRKRTLLLRREITLLQVTLQGYSDPGSAIAAAELKA